MKSVSVMAVIVILALMAGFSSVTGSAAVEPGTAVEARNLPVAMPVSQELPFDRYWSKD